MRQPSFIEWIQRERHEFSRKCHEDSWWIEMLPDKRVMIENILIAYDQMIQKIKDLESQLNDKTQY